jgi:1,2-diacylglycerol 3-beta-glucosyltransferase
VVRRILLALEGMLTLSTLYLLGLLLAAHGARRGAAKRDASAAGAAPGPNLRLVVLVPAHDEEAGIAATLAALTGADYPEQERRIVVIADNCGDRTADVAAAAGAEVWERTDPKLRGKGHALAWALERLLALDDRFDGVVFVDADCIVSANLLAAVDARLRGGARAMQVDYVAANPEDSSAAALRFAAFAVGDTVRFLGKERLGLSCGLVGTGMAFTRDLLERNPWTATGLVEDGEFHMRLVLAGERVEFVPEAQVSQAVPTSLKASSSQQARWEMGKLQLIRRWSGRLILAGLLKRDALRLHAGLECLVPPQSVIAIGNLGSALAGLLLGSRRLLALSLFTAAAQGAFVLGGLRLVRAPAYVYRALLSAPALVLSKLGLYGRLLSGRGPTAWVRTEREPAQTAPVEVRA